MPEAWLDNVASPVARKFLQLHLAPDVGPIRLRNLLAALGSIDAVLGASIRELTRAEGVGAKVAAAVFRSRDGDAVAKELARTAECGVRILCWDDADYPAALRHIPDPPICLYVKGTLEPTDAVAMAIVGTRRCSHYGREQAVRFGELLGNAGFTVVSGLARGIDGCAHQGALRGGGRTVAVLGNGLSAIYPPEHEELAGQIIANGAMVSELPVDTAPEAGNFPRRNRIIVGLSLGVIVVEAGKGSGALITARLANEYNREVFAVPGRIDQPERSAGVHALIRDGHAKLVTCLEDVLDELGPVGETMGRGVVKPANDAREAPAASSLAAQLNPSEQTVARVIAESELDAEGVVERTGLDAGAVLSSLTSLELKGVVRRLPSGRFVARTLPVAAGD